VYYVAVPEQKVGASCAIVNEQLYFGGKQVKKLFRDCLLAVERAAIATGSAMNVAEYL